MTIQKHYFYFAFSRGTEADDILRKIDETNLALTRKFDNESRHKIGTTTFIITAHFDESRDDLKTKITKLIQNDVGINIDSHTGLGQSGGI